jgi:hypothetical protein
MRFTVPRIITGALVGLLSIVFGVQPAWATICTRNSQCSSLQTCQDTGLGGKQCGQLRCNFDSDCPADRATCREGICQGPATSGGGAGIPQSDVGQACGPRKIGQVTKNVGCKPGLQCVKVPPSSSTGTCQVPPH